MSQEEINSRKIKISSKISAGRVYEKSMKTKALYERVCKKIYKNLYE
ncbi:MAG: hypothetical protein PVF73_12355 [Bacteroidales bacterium]|jgi:hypothetical protein